MTRTNLWAGQTDEEWTRTMQMLYLSTGYGGTGEAKELAWSVNTNINQCCPSLLPPPLSPQQTHTKGNPKSLLFVLIERSVCFASTPGWRWLCRRFASYGQCWLCDQSFARLANQFKQARTRTVCLVWQRCGEHPLIISLGCIHHI